jgi:hypothetical protein
MATAKRATARAARKVKVIQVRVKDGSELATKLEAELNAFLKENAKASLESTHLHMLDIGGQSQADLIAVFTVIYSG